MTAFLALKFDGVPVLFVPIGARMPDGPPFIECTRAASALGVGDRFTFDVVWCELPLRGEEAAHCLRKYREAIDLLRNDETFDQWMSATWAP